jgi:hypothetical protein
VPSPFPGTDPYLEQDDVWEDFHQSYIPLARAAIMPQVQPAYIVKVEEYLFIHELPEERRRYLRKSDLGLADPHQRAVATRAASLKAPAYGTVPMPVDIERHSFLAIRDKKNRDLVTVIELLSPSNKRPGPDREQYLAKRRQLLLSPVHLVEIDLLRGWPRMPVEDLRPCDYTVLVSRADERPRVGLWSVDLREKLPTIPIPLRGNDPDAHLDIRAILDQVYDSAGYQEYIYSAAPEPRLSEEQESWARQFLPHS